MTELDIRCEPTDAGDGWMCDVAVTEDGGTATRHRVHVAAADLERLDPGAPSPYLLVDDSFRFLLARERPSSILRSFDLMEIARYFPEFEAQVRRR
jgi:hypothetical protein